MRDVRRHAPALLAALLFSPACPTGPALAGPPDEVKIEEVAFGGWDRNLKISNGEVELIVTLEVGPRVISYRWLDGENVFKTYDDQLGKSGEDSWQIRGGHRLWTSHELPDRTYAPDNRPVQVERLGPGHVRLTPADDGTGLSKILELRLEPEGSLVNLSHWVANVGTAPATAAPWALSVMKGGGVEIIPRPEKRPHPGGAEKATAEDFAPNHAVITWPYFRWDDDRFRFGERYITLTHKERGSTKIGLVHTPGWVGYLNGGTLFVKRFARQEGAAYPDLGSNYETYANEDMVEMESLGPLMQLEPGVQMLHVETWELHKVDGEPTDEEAIDRLLPEAVRGR